MNSLLDETEDEHEQHLGRRMQHAAPDREITLGTTMILLIFFALAVQDAAVFGFGFSMGGKHTAGPSTTGPATASTAAFGMFKPAPGKPLGSTEAVKPSAVDSTPTPLSTPVPSKSTAAPIERVDVAAEENPAPPPPPKPVAVSPAAAAAAAMPVAPTVAAGPGTFVVQVAALSRQEDADMIGTTLRRRGYLVNIRTDADRLLHVQVGPFATHKDAEAMKAKLLADGFNAYIK